MSLSTSWRHPPMSAAKEDGGLGLPLKSVQALLGHATLSMTADTYGHLFPSTDAHSELAAAEEALGLHMA